MGISTPVKKRRTRTANAVVKRDPALVDAFLAERLAAQADILARMEREREEVTYVSPFVGCSYKKEFSCDADAVAYAEWLEERSHAIERVGPWRGRFA